MSCVTPLHQQEVLSCSCPTQLAVKYLIWFSLILIRFFQSPFRCCLLSAIAFYGLLTWWICQTISKDARQTTNVTKFEDSSPFLKFLVNMAPISGIKLKLWPCCRDAFIYLFLNAQTSDVTSIILSVGVCMYCESCCYLNLLIYYQVKIVFHLLVRHIRCFWPDLQGEKRPLSKLLFSKNCAARRNTVRSCQPMHAKNSSLSQTRPCKNLNGKTTAHCCVEATEIVLKRHIKWKNFAPEWQCARQPSSSDLTSLRLKL